MAQITIPRLPDPPQDYNREQQAQLVQTLEQLIFLLNNNFFLSIMVTGST